jgi:hypothetical protein
MTKTAEKCFSAGDFIYVNFLLPSDFFPPLPFLRFCKQSLLITSNQHMKWTGLGFPYSCYHDELTKTRPKAQQHRQKHSCGGATALLFPPHTPKITLQELDQNASSRFGLTECSTNGYT